MTRLLPASPGSRRRRLSLLSGLVLLQALLAISQAQITLDGSLGPPGPLPGPHARIGAELGQIRGSNLFNSFGQFSVPTGGSATCTGPATIANILSRVTGGQPSVIDGLLRSEIAGANLYLLNPSGVLFEPNARLEVSGSFHVSTADYVRFADGATFFGNLGQAGVLTVAPPAAFGFLGHDPAPITIRRSTLRVSEGDTLSVVGGDMTIVGGPFTANGFPRVGAPSGRLQLVSVASPGEVGFSPLKLAPDLQPEAFARLGRIVLMQGARLDASGNGGGTVLLRGGHLLVDGSFIRVDNTGNLDGMGPGLDLRITGDTLLTNEALILSSSGFGTAGGGVSSGRARDLRLTARSLHIMGNSGIVSGVGRSGALGRSGNIVVQVGTLTLTRGGGIDTSTATGRGGDITVVATEAIAIGGLDADQRITNGLTSVGLGSGEGGKISVMTPLLTMGSAGEIAVDSSLLSSGNAGSIEVRAGRVTLTSGAQISSSTGGCGRGGAVTLAATETIAISGARSGIFSSTVGRGPGGAVRVTAPHIQLSNGGTIAASSETPVVFPRGPGEGLAGSILIQASETFLSQNGLVTTNSSTAGGGTIALTAGRLVQLQDSALTTAVRGGGGDAGNLTLDAPLVIAEGSQMVANAFGGMGGNIRINAGVFLADPASQVRASSELGISGTVAIQAPVTTLSGTLAPPPQAFMSVAALLPARCAARASDGRYSSLVLGGRDGLPADPSGVLPSPLVFNERLGADPAVMGAPPQQTSAATVALLAGQEKALPRLGCPP